MKATLVEHVDVAAPAAAAWAHVTDWPRHHEWMIGTTARVTGGGEAGVGSRLVAFTGVGGVGFTDTMEITAWDPPRRCAVRHVGRVVRGDGIIEVRPRGAAGCAVVWTERLDLPFGAVGRLGWLLVGPLFHSGLRWSLRRLARLVEAGAR